MLEQPCNSLSGKSAISPRFSPFLSKVQTLNFSNPKPEFQELKMPSIEVARNSNRILLSPRILEMETFFRNPKRFAVNKPKKQAFSSSSIKSRLNANNIRIQSRSKNVNKLNQFFGEFLGILSETSAHLFRRSSEA